MAENTYIIDANDAAMLILQPPYPIEIADAADRLLKLASKELMGGRRLPVRLVRDPYGLVVEADGHTETFNFFSFGNILSCMVRGLMCTWQVLFPGVVEGKLTGWAMKQTDRVLGERIHAEWKRLVEQADPTVLSVHRKVFSAAYKYQVPLLLVRPRLYLEPYLIKDITSYRAAAVAAWACGELDEEQAIQQMTNWRDVFSPVGPYRELNRTLVNLPGSVPASLLCVLNTMRLPRPITNRLELITVLCAGPQPPGRYRVFAFATADQIKEAMKRISAHLHKKLSPRRTKDIGQAVDFLLDYPDDHRGNIVGLANKAIRWHRDCWREQAEESTIHLSDDTPIAVPPIPLPQVEGVRFLATVGDLRNESNTMQHCIRHYAKRAGDDECYLFHVEHDGERASVEVSPFGFVNQSQGPSNSQNRATEWGRNVLDTWAAAMRDMTKVGGRY
jgi:hypothetical protein